MPRFQAHERPPPSSSLSVSESSFSDALRFQAHQPAPLSSSPPESEPSFVTCHVSKLTNLILLFFPSSLRVLIFDMPCFQAHQPAPPSSSPPDGESSFCTVPHFQPHQPL